jgi:hypothetical protein
VKAYQQLNIAFKKKKKEETSFKLNFPDKNFVQNYSMWTNDFNGKLSGHIILVCPVEYFTLIADVIRTRSMKPIVYLNEKTSSSLWARVSA